MSKIKVDIKETSQNKLGKMYTSALNDLVKETEKVVTKVSNIADKENFKVIIDLSVELASFYNNDLKQIVNTEFNEWFDSDASLHSLVQSYMAGEDAIQEAKKVEKGIKDNIDEMFRKQLQGSNATQNNATIDPEKLQEISDELGKYINKIDGDQKNHLSKIAKEAESNQLYNIIVGHVKSTYEGSIAGFGVAANKAGITRQQLDAAMKKGNANLEDVNKTIGNNAKQGASSVTTFPKVFL